MERNTAAKAVAGGVVVTGLAYWSYCMYRRRASPLRPLVVCGPSGVGKGTLLEMSLKEFPNKFAKCISHTTRAPRKGEVDGVHYHFSSKDKIRGEIADKKFLEFAEVHGNIYGTSFAAIEEVRDQGKICILEIDVQGAEKLREAKLASNYYFFYPPSFDALSERLTGRGSENADTLRLRLETAKTELDFMEKCNYVDFELVNDDLASAHKKLITRLLSDYPQLAK